jgi:hypothetical protein
MPMRIVMVGQEEYFGVCRPEGDRMAPGTSVAWLSFRDGDPTDDLAERIRQANPDLLIVFRPEFIPKGLLEGIDAVRIAWFSEPLPPAGPDSEGAHPDLLARSTLASRFEPSNFDRVIVYSPLIEPAVNRLIQRHSGYEESTIWRVVPLPVGDRIFSDGEQPNSSAGNWPATSTPIFGFVGRSTEYREKWLAPLKAESQLRHIAHGMNWDDADALHYDVAINIHNQPYPNFENRVPVEMAAGRLVISESLTPGFGLEPGIDYIEVAHPNELSRWAKILGRDAAVGDVIRRRGRLKAEQFRASAVFGRLWLDANLARSY